MSRNELGTFVSELIGRLSIDRVDTEAFFPIVSPLGPMSALDYEDQVFDSLWYGFEPLVEFGGEERFRRREQFDDRAKGTVRA